MIVHSETRRPAAVIAWPTSRTITAEEAALQEARAMLALDAQAARTAEREAKRILEAQGKTVTDSLSLSPSHLVIQAAAAGDNVIIPGSGSLRIAIYQLDFYNSDAQTIQFLDGIGGSKLRGDLTNFAGGAGYFLPFSDEPHFVLSPGKAFVLNLSAGAAVGGFLKFRMLEKWAS
ncbi:MAG: hypothetical protein IT160_07120 [Bryobacterales bacterium]|nr:hypothetical protein [Bryobacterales bacterium]